MTKPSGSIEQRLIVICIGLYFCVACLITIAEAIFVSDSIKEEREAQIGALAKTNVPALAQALWDYDSPMIELILRGLVAHPAIGRVELLAPGGAEEYALEAPPPAAKPVRVGSSASTDLGPAHAFKLVHGRSGKEDAFLGELIVYPSLLAEHQQFWKTITRGLWGIAILVVFLSAILAIVAEKLIGRPIRSLASQIGRIKATDPRAADLHAPAKATGELAFIAAAFIELVGNIGATMSTLRESERRLRSLFEDSPISIWEEDFSEAKRRIDAARAAGVSDWPTYFAPRDRVMEYASALRLTDINAATLALLGYSDKASIFGSFRKILGEGDLETLRAEFVALASGRTGFEGETLHFSADGEPVFVSVKLGIVPGYEGSWGRVIVSIIDLTERKKTERALRESEAKFRSLVEQSAEGIILIDGEGTLVEANPILERMTGLAKEGMLGRKVWDLEYGLLPAASRSGADLERIRAKWRDSLAGGRGGSSSGLYETLLENTPGSSRIIEQIVFPISMKHGRMAGAILRDVTEERTMTRSLSESLREKELLLQEVHHRVKNNLQIICSLIDLQSNELRASPSTQRSLMDIEARVRSISLVHELLYQSDSFARVDFGSYVAQLIGYLSEIYAADTERVRIAVAVSDVQLALDKAIPCGLLVNEMVVNSLKHAFPDGRSGTIEIAMVEAGPRSISLTIRDDGIGMPKGSLEMSRPSIGLSLVMSLIKQLDGSYDLATEGGVRLQVVFDT